MDIETAPHLAYVWNLWRQNVSLSQLKTATQMICFGAKWYGEKKVFFASDFHDGHTAMVDLAWKLLNEADAVVHYNGESFDIPHMNREFLLNDYAPPAPFQQIDLLKTVRKQFRFASNKLDHVTQQLGQAGKVHHSGFEMWLGCLNNDPKSWAEMRRYNKRDVTELEPTYETLRPWILSHPHLGLYSGKVGLDPETGKPMTVQRCDRCPNGGRLIKQGFAYTRRSKFQRFQCLDCGGWSRGKTSIARVDAGGIG